VFHHHRSHLYCSQDKRRGVGTIMAGYEAA
jgi:hypothetical protein